MTIPYELTLAVLDAGGFLTDLNGDPRVPLEHRRTADNIARHFPCVEDVEQMALMEFRRLGTGMFESPRDCPSWREHCPGVPLTRSIRLPTPTEQNEDESDLDESDEDVVSSRLARLGSALMGIVEAKQAASETMERAFKTCVAMMPALRGHFDALQWDDRMATEWLCGWTWDASGRSAALLISSGEGAAVLERLQQTAKGRRPNPSAFS